MALDMTPEQKAVGRGNFHRAIGKLAEASSSRRGLTRRRFMQGLVGATATLPVAATAYFGYTNSDFVNRPVKAGLIGAGDEGGVLVGEHNPAYLQFIAYSDIRPSNQVRIFEDDRARSPTSLRKGFKFHYGNDARTKIRPYEDYRQMLQNPDIEAVVIALPLHLHAEAAIAAMRAGKHVLCEKLMAWNISQCKEMIRVANETQRILSIGHQRHYSMLYAHAVEVINSGVLGEIRHIRALWHRNNTVPRLRDDGQPQTEVIAGQTLPMYRDSWRPPIEAADLRRFPTDDTLRRLGYKSLNELVRWRLYQRTGGGLMAELGSHQLDACSIFLGKRRDRHVIPIAVTALGGKHFYQDDRETEDHVYCTFEFPGRNYDPQRRSHDQAGKAQYNDVITVTYSSVSTNAFEAYGECVMGNKGTLVVEGEQSAMLYGVAGRSTAVTVSSTGGRPAITAADSEVPGERRAGDIGQASLGLAPPSRGYREEMEHFAYCIRMRDQGTERDRDDERLRPRCDGQAAMDDAIIALTANQAIRRQQRIVFNPAWFDPASRDVPDADMVPERI